jgi:hypothetical protein
MSNVKEVPLGAQSIKFRKEGMGKLGRGRRLPQGLRLEQGMI